jgi:hypothetical protein
MVNANVSGCDICAGSITYSTIKNAHVAISVDGKSPYLSATSDYWSANPPSDAFFYGSVDRSSPLASPPSNPPAGPGWSLPKSAGEDFFLAFNDASILFYNGKYQDARARFKILTEKYLDSEYSSYALNWTMLSTERMETIGTQKEYLGAVLKNGHAHANTRFYALKWLLQC